MKIHITKKEYRVLLHMLYMAEWVINSHGTNEDEIIKPYKDLEQKLLSYAKDFGYENLVEYAKEMKEFFPTRMLDEDEPLREFINEFEENTFWHELCERLAQRDLVEEIGFEEIKKLDPLEAMNKEDEIALKYSEEFHKNGINNLILNKK